MRTKRTVLSFTTAGILFVSAQWEASASPPALCAQLQINVLASRVLRDPDLPTKLNNCTTKVYNGVPLPDRNCTPGAVNPTVTLEVLTTKGFTTRCIRNQTTSATQKNAVYGWYGLEKPYPNRGSRQVCQLDHIVPLELGGADTLDNMWPQCGPDNVPLNQRFFKQKDTVEDFLTKEVRAGRISLEEAQRRIAENWAQFLKQNPY